MDTGNQRVWVAIISAVSMLLGGLINKLLAYITSAKSSIISDRSAFRKDMQEQIKELHNQQLKNRNRIQQLERESDIWKSNYWALFEWLQRMRDKLDLPEIPKFHLKPKYYNNGEKIDSTEEDRT